MRSEGSFRGRPIGRRLLRRRPALGVFVWELAGAGMWPILAPTGLDFAVIDNEHSGFSARETAMLLAGARSTSLPALVRVPDVTRTAIGRVLDLGADGVIAPRVGTRAEAEELVRYAKYAPAGDRGIAYGCAHDAYGAEGSSLDQLTQIANDEIVCVAMIETAEGVDAAAAIAATPGIDALWIGFADLSQSLGRSGDYESEAFRRAEERVLGAAASNDLPVGVLVPSGERALAQIRRGYSAIALGTEVTVLQRGISAMVEMVRSGLDG